MGNPTGTGELEGKAFAWRRRRVACGRSFEKELLLLLVVVSRWTAVSKTRITMQAGVCADLSRMESKRLRERERERVRRRNKHDTGDGDTDQVPPRSSYGVSIRRARSRTNRCTIPSLEDSAQGFDGSIFHYMEPRRVEFHGFGIQNMDDFEQGRTNGERFDHQNSHDHPEQRIDRIRTHTHTFWRRRRGRGSRFSPHKGPFIGACLETRDPNERWTWRITSRSCIATPHASHRPRLCRLRGPPLDPRFASVAHPGDRFATSL